MNIQIFGTSKCFDTKKAQRYFKERGIKFQMIDLKEKEMSRGEFENVSRALGCLLYTSIGSNFVHYMLKKYPEILLVNLDKLTYAGNLENLKDVEGDPRHVFVQGDICDKELVESLFAKYDFDYVINFAAESHVDRSIKNPEIFVQSNVMGTVNLLQRAKEAWYDADAKTWKEGKKYLQVSTDEVYGALGAEGFFMETTPLLSLIHI